ncbi:hypothetical protein B0A55_07084 [Friedmanniomyces simplex]|uniref:HTH APSES-type domain-containing protein n=1 Tax=Friedmanniomyces simplex TaxID=329884 RepID=A0A4U0XHI8_9PEZI|nr:hypothetical protein B0A55_07084 [Friedmanniomyces simplex]
MRGASISQPPTPAFTHVSSTASTPVPQTPVTATSSQQRTKLVKDAAIFVRGTPKEPVKYPPYECTEDSICLSDHAMEDLAQQQERFAVFPSGRGDEGLVADYQRHIPYSSEKKMFHGKTNRDAFEVFQYTFRVPPGTVKKQPENFHMKEHVVMWDYQVGLVRITPFFKALVYSKTTPGKAIAANPGLKELSHSITGGALAAQGYWMPYSCARALCLTFCYDIRWALTAIFGTSFIKECLHPTHSGFEKFKIDSEVLRCAQLEAEGWLSETSSRSGSPGSASNGQYGNGQLIPRSVPHLTTAPQPKQLRPRPTFKAGSPFESDSDHADANYTHAATGLDSPELSPNFPPVNTWRSLGLSASDAAPEKRIKMPTSAHEKLRSQKRRMSVQAVGEDAEYTAVSSSGRGGSESEGDEVEAGELTSPSPSSSSRGATTTKKKKRQRLEGEYRPTLSPAPASPPLMRSTHSTPVEMREAAEMTEAGTRETAEAREAEAGSTEAGRNVCLKYNATDARAARWLLNLSLRDSQLACGPRGMKGQKRKASAF